MSRLCWYSAGLRPGSNIAYPWRSVSVEHGEPPCRIKHRVVRLCERAFKIRYRGYDLLRVRAGHVLPLSIAPCGRRLPALRPVTRHCARFCRLTSFPALCACGHQEVIQVLRRVVPQHRDNFLRRIRFAFARRMFIVTFGPDRRNPVGSPLFLSVGTLSSSNHLGGAGMSNIIGVLDTAVPPICSHAACFGRGPAGIVRPDRPRIASARANMPQLRLRQCHCLMCFWVLLPHACRHSAGKC